MKRRLRLVACGLAGLFAILAIAPFVSADDSANDELWKKAAQSYRSGQPDTGHIRLKNLMEQNAGDIDLAVKCLQTIFNNAGRYNREDFWTRYSARRLCALVHIGAISANSQTIREAFEVTIEESIQEGRLLELVDVIDRLVKDNPHDLFWQIQQATIYRRIGSLEARPLFDKLSAEIDLDHPHPAARARWMQFAPELEAGRQDLPLAIQPLPKGSPLPLMEPDDPDGEWQTLAIQSPWKKPVLADRLAAKALMANRIVGWRDGSGLTDPVRALDLHLLSQPRAQLGRLRTLQADRYRQEDNRESEATRHILALSRRYAWALPAQKRLLELANRELWGGCAQAALRSFQELLNHAADQTVLDAAQVGYWTALTQIDDRGTLEELLGGVDPARRLTWLGKPTAAKAICEQLISPQRAAAADAVPLRDLAQHVVRLPPVSPWSTDLPAAVDLAVAGQDLLASGRDMLVMYNARQPGKPVWSSYQRHHAGNTKSYGHYPGYFRPLINGGVLYTRWGFDSVPSGIAAIDRATGRPLWSNQPPQFSRQRRRRFAVPMGDPLLSDGLLYYLQWNTQDNVHQTRGRRLRIVCYDPRQRVTVWENTIAEAGLSSDMSASLERAAPQSAIYGNRVTIHQGALYSVSNCGIVARSDVRDGRTDWMHYYRRSPRGSNILNVGSPPIIAGNNIICMPRDSSRVFALDRKTGRLVWENPLVLGVEVIGVHDDLLIVRGQAAVAGLDVATGQARWYRPNEEPLLGRAHMAGSSVYLAHLGSLLRLDAKTGHLAEERKWDLGDERPRSFTIAGRDLYVVTDRPAADPLRDESGPLNPSIAAQVEPLALPLQRAWTLPRENARISFPPKDSPLHGKGYVISSRIIECLDVSARGGILWRRFIDARSPALQFVGNRLLVVDHSNVSGLANRVVAYDGTDGRIIWQHVVPSHLHQSINCGATQVFHDDRSRVVAVDLSTGKRVWERHFGRSPMMRVARDGDRLHIFVVSAMRTAHHLTLNADSGETLSENLVEIRPGPQTANNGKAMSNGYYEVTVSQVTARYVRLVALSEVNGQGWTSIAELQVIGKDGNNVSREKWIVRKVDSFEANARMSTAPERAFDNDPATWWHTQWIGGIPRHPHEIQIDLGAQQKIEGIRYLPAVIVNNNGMIKDYELYVSNDGQNWGPPIAKGELVNRIRVDRAHLVNNAILFESRDRTSHHNRIYRYSMDGKPARQIHENGRVIFHQGPYYITMMRNGKKQDHLYAHRFDDRSYQFELAPNGHYDTNSMKIENDRLIMGRRGVLVADLAKKRFIVPPTPNGEKHNQHGLLVSESSDNLLKFVNAGAKGQLVYRFDMKTGERTESILSDQLEQFQPSGQQAIQHYDGVLVLYDNASITAWVANTAAK